MRPVEYGCAGHNAVVVVRKVLRLFQPLFASRRAAHPIGKLGIVTVEGFDGCLGLDRHFVLGAPREIDQFLRMSQRETAAASDVAGVRAAGGVSAHQRLSHVGVSDGACPSAISYSLIL